MDKMSSEQVNYSSLLRSPTEMGTKLDEALFVQTGTDVYPLRVNECSYSVVNVLVVTCCGDPSLVDVVSDSCSLPMILLLTFIVLFGSFLW